MSNGSGDENRIAKRLDADVAKVDDRLGIVFGYAIVCKRDGEDYYDVQGDHIPESAMLRATSAFMAGERMAKVMHKGQSVGTIVHSLPLTEDLADALGLAVEKTGWVIGFKPSTPEVLEQFRSGELKGFSIGGRRIAEEVIE